MNNADWWANKLAGNTPAAPVGRPANMPPMPPSQQPLPVMPTFQPQTGQPGLNLPSMSQTETCPDCGSANYMAVQNTAPRCLDCGYPIQQSGSRYGSLAGAHVDGAAKAASGNSTQNNWNPQGIIGRIN